MAECSFIDYRLQDGGVGVLTLDNPPLNLTTLATLDKLLAACRDIAADERLRVLVVTGSGSKAFCAGSDISEFPHVREDVVSRKLARENTAFTALEQLPMPVIAALNGVALGGGAEIALACDIRIMDETARIGFPEVKLGIFPGSGGIFRLPRLVGPAKAYELFYSGELIDAQERTGLGSSTASRRPVTRYPPLSLSPRCSRAAPRSRSASSAPLCGIRFTKRPRRQSAGRLPTAIKSSPVRTSKKASTPFSPNARRSSRLDAAVRDDKKRHAIEAWAALVVTKKC
jgi:enoyl-CoA hydratase/carnithine racemase